MKKMSTKYLIRVSISVILLILLDQLTKIWAVVRLKDQPAISLIRGVFELQYLENRGSAFGMMQGARVFLSSVRSFYSFSYASYTSGSQKKKCICRCA